MIRQQLPGMIGARSNYSGGKANVEEWVNAAKAAGLNYLVFLEPLDFISEENFNKFKADCAKYTDDNFFACPGLWGKDIVYQNQYVYLRGECAIPAGDDPDGG